MRRCASRKRFSRLLRRPIALRHYNPHSILGAHATPNGVIVRTYRPGARKIFLLIDDKSRREMMPRSEEGLFEILVSDRLEIFPYRLEVHYADERVFTIHSPYSFLPTLSEVDLYLLGEQKHERPYDKLGA